MATGFVTKKRNDYYCVIPVGGKQKWIPAGKVRKRADKKLAELMHQIHRGEYVEMQQITFKDFANKWLKDYAKPSVRTNTYRFYDDIIRCHLIPFFGDFKLTTIRPHIIQEYLAEKIEENKLSPTTIGYQIRVLRTILKRAVIWGFLSQNPAKHIEKPRVERKEMQCLSVEEINCFLDHVTPGHYCLFLTAAHSGLRRGELLGLLWKDISWDNGQIHVRRSVVRGVLEEPKSKTSTRAVIVPPAAMKALKKHRMASPFKSEDDLVFPNNGGKPMDPNNMVRRHFLPALKRAGVKRVRFHDLRHSYASLLIAGGENIKFVQSQLGHSSAKITLDRYAHVTLQIQHGAEERIAKIFAA